MKKISELRKRSGYLSQRELAEALKVTQATISRWEQNQTTITGSNLIKLAKFFNVSIDDILGLENRGL